MSSSGRTRGSPTPPARVTALWAFRRERIIKAADRIRLSAVSRVFSIPRVQIIRFSEIRQARTTRWETEMPFFGKGAGSTNSIGTNNTVIGTFADVTANNLTNATAVGYAAQVSQSNSLVLGGVGENGAIARTAP